MWLPSMRTMAINLMASRSNGFVFRDMTITPFSGAATVPPPAGPVKDLRLFWDSTVGKVLYLQCFAGMPAGGDRRETALVFDGRCSPWYDVNKRF